MPDAVTKRCPQCGQRTTSLQLAECPYCRVALVTETGGPSGELTREQAQAVARHLLGSWKLWAAVIVLIALAAWGVVRISQSVIDSRSKDYLSALQETTSNRLAIASSQIAKEVSKQIETEVKKADVAAAVDQAARVGVNNALSNSMWPSLEEFRRALARANGQLAKASNELARLDRDIRLAENKAALAQTQLAQPSNAPSTSSSPRVITPAVPNPPATPPGNSPKLTVANQAVSQNGSDYILTLFFNQVGSQSIGSVNLMAGTYRQTARIVNFGLVTQGQSQPMVLNDTRDAAQLTFNVAAGDSPIVALEVTGPTIVRLTSDALSQDLTLPVAADKLVSPSAAR